MKLIATADWHLGNIFHGNDRIAEQRHFLEWLTCLISDEHPDALLIAGDIFDNGNPSAASQSLYYGFLDTVSERFPSLTVVITAGNHDSATRLEAPRPIMRRHGIHIRGALQIRHEQDTCGNDSGTSGTIRRVAHYEDLMIPIGDPEAPQAVILAMPYLRADAVRGTSYAAGVREALEEVTRRARELYPDTVTILMAHLYAGGAEIAAGSSERIIIGGLEQIDMNGWHDHPDYMVCGHIHRRQGVHGAVWARYPGSVLPMSFAEREYTHGVDVVTFDAERIPTVRQAVYRPLRPLVIIPENRDGTDLTARQLERLIERTLSVREGPHPDDNAPYVALRINADRINADLRHRVETFVESRNAILCKTETISDNTVPTIDGTSHLHTVGDILERPVIDTISEAYRLRHGEDMSEHRRELLTELLAGLECTDL